MINYLFTNPLLFIVYIVALLVAITIHEFSHAWMADYLGDPTARLSGRLKLNPLVHIDGIGMLFLFFFGFGWGKPVPFDPYNLKNPRKDAALISFAGPLSNIFIALSLSLLLKMMVFFNLSGLFMIGSFLLIPVIYLNVILGLFNLLPINPLDGFKIVGGLLSEEKARQWYELERYGMIFLLLLILPLGQSSMLDMFIRPIISFIINLLIPTNIGGSLI